MSNSRRSFIKYASLAAAGNAAGLRPFGMLNSLAQTPVDYKALVCVFLYGGNDANNMLIPFDTTGYGNYASVRGPLAIAQNQLLQLASAPNFALNPNLPDIQSLFNSKAAALVTNVGTLIQPTDRKQYLAGTTVPANLFSHADQQLEWQNASESAATQTGWAGRIADIANSSLNPNATIPMITSVAGDTLFCNGATSTPVSVSPGNLKGATCSESSTECGAQQATAQALLSFSSGLSLVQADNSITQNAYSYAKTLSDAVQSISPLKTAFPASNGLAAQLKQIAQIIQVRGALGVSRQIFFAGIGSFDTHSNQLAQQGGLLASIGPALAAFYHVGLQQNLPTELEHRLRPCLGLAPHCHGRRGERRPNVRDLPQSGPRRTRRLRIEWPMDSDDGERAVRRNPCAVVRGQALTIDIHLPKYWRFRQQQSRISRVNCVEPVGLQSR
jgi:uncharacterized protein (DUF1501 family)